MARLERQAKIFLLGDSMEVHAPIERCFGLTRSVALVHQELGMQVRSGRATGLVEHGDLVRWEGWQLGLKHVHLSHISSFESPVFLQDTMIEGRFRTFQHDHHLKRISEATTLLQDEVRFSLPFGGAGLLVGRMILVPHIRRLLRNRFSRIKRLAEGDGWKKYLPDEVGITLSGEVEQ